MLLKTLQHSADSNKCYNIVIVDDGGYTWHDALATCREGLGFLPDLASVANADEQGNRKFFTFADPERGALCQISFNFHVVFGKMFCQIIGWGTHLWGWRTIFWKILHPPLPYIEKQKQQYSWNNT